MNLDILKADISDFTSTFSTGIGLDVDGLHWVLKVDVFERDSSHTVVVDARRDGANRHADTKHNIDVSDSDILRASIFGNDVSFISWLNDNGVVPVGDVDVLDCDVGT